MQVDTVVPWAASFCPRCWASSEDPGPRGPSCGPGERAGLVGRVGPRAGRHPAGRVARSQWEGVR